MRLTLEQYCAKTKNTFKKVICLENNGYMKATCMNPEKTLLLDVPKIYSMHYV